MNITDKIRNAKFTKRGKGYDTAEIDEFLDSLIEDFEKEQKRIADREIEIDEAQKGIVKALLTAQTAAQNIENEAKAKADAIIQEANAKAEKVVDDAKNSEIELVDKIKDMKSFSDAYRDALIKDMENQLDLFKASFLADAVYDQYEEIVPSEETGLSEEYVAEETAETVEEKPELETGEMASINLGEIISGLPQSDSELKALIDEIM